MEFSLTFWAAVLEKGMWIKSVADGNVDVATQVGNRRAFTAANVALHGLFILLFQRLFPFHPSFNIGASQCQEGSCQQATHPRK